VLLSEYLRQPNTKKNSLTQQPEYDVKVELITHLIPKPNTAISRWCIFAF